MSTRANVDRTLHPGSSVGLFVRPYSCGRASPYRSPRRPVAPRPPPRRRGLRGGPGSPRPGTLATLLPPTRTG